CPFVRLYLGQRTGRARDVQVARGLARPAGRVRAGRDAARARRDVHDGRIRASSRVGALDVRGCGGARARCRGGGAGALPPSAGAHGRRGGSLPRGSSCAREEPWRHAAGSRGRGRHDAGGLVFYKVSQEDTMLRSTLRSTLRSKPYATHIAMLLAAASFALPAVARAQNMVQNGQIDPQTAVRLGKLFGAQYAVTGAFISDPHGKAILTAHTIDVETSQIANPNSVNGTTDDVLGMIAQLSSRLASNLNLAPKPGAARRTGDAGTGAKSEPAQSGAPASKAVETFAKPVAEEAMKIKLDPATVRVYSSAIDEADKKNKAKATDLFRQVLAKYPKFEPAQRQLDRLTH